MMQTLPTPILARPLEPVDPYRHRDAFVRLLSVLYHAEAAAMEGFKLLCDPRYVQKSEMFVKTSRRLVEDEARHLSDLEELVRELGAPGILPPDPSAAEFWGAWRAGDVLALPFKPAVASLFCLFSEGLGYAILYHLAELTSAPNVRAKLRSNVEDETMHLRLSMAVLRKALEHDPHGFLADFLVYVAGYCLMAKRFTREHRDVLDELGLDYSVMVGSSARFLLELLALVVGDEGPGAPVWRALYRGGRLLGEHPLAVDALYATMFLPEPPFGRHLVYAWGRLGLFRAGVAESDVRRKAAELALPPEAPAAPSRTRRQQGAGAAYAHAAAE
jgi:hypothetical protein